MKHYNFKRKSWMNTKQWVAIWVTGFLLSLALFFCFFDFRYDYPEKIPLSYKPLKSKEYRIPGVRIWYYHIRILREICPLLLISIPPILIAEGLLIYKLRD